MSGNVFNCAALTAPGAGSAIQTGLNVNHTFAAVVSSINTNVVLRIEGTLDGTNWFNLSDTNADTTITANGTYGFMATGMLYKIRGNFVSESGGSAAIVEFSYLG